MWFSAVSDGVPAPLAEAARIIAPDGPAWLADGLARGAVYLAEIAAAERAHPTRQQWRAKMQRLAAASAELVALLDEPAVRTLFLYDRKQEAAFAAELAAIMGEPPGRVTLYDGTRSRAANVARAVLAAIASVAEAEGVRAGGGRDKAVPNPSGESALGICAGLVAMAWRIARGDAVPYGSPVAWRACEMVWTAATGGTARGGGNPDAPPLWRHHLDAANAAADAGRLGILRDFFTSASTRHRLQIIDAQNGR